METCIRGFSFMPESKVEATDLQYIESVELEHTWKTSRRLRLKEQEQKVWEEFVQEQDVVKSIYKDDPYQFLHQLPESCLKELMESELQKVKKEVEQENNVQPSLGEGDFQPEEVPHTVTFVEDTDDCDIFHIFDDKDEPSGPEDEFLANSAGSPCTVRERDSENVSPVPLLERDAIKSSENVSNVIESSIYCAKVKDLRLNIRDEMLDIMTSLDQVGVAGREKDDVSRMCRRAAEFSARFSRIHMYQLQRQMQDVKRNTLRSMPFAQHTHFHAQMQRVASLHQNLLQALQVFHKSLPQTSCVRESAAVLHSLALAAREVSALCAAVPSPKDLNAAKSLYDDELLVTCDKLDEAVCEHSLRLADFLSTTDATSSPSRKFKGKRRTGGPSTKSTKSIPDSEARLSMYSLDTLRLNLNKSTSSKDNASSGTSKPRASLSSAASKHHDNQPNKTNPKKSPRSRRPLMRGGARGAGRARARPPRDSEITTMVEAVETCPSSRMSRETSPRGSGVTPRTPRNGPSPRARHKLPKAKNRRAGGSASPIKSPKRTLIKALDSVTSDARESDRSPNIKHPIPLPKELNIRKTIVKGKVPVSPRADKAKEDTKKFKVEIPLEPKDNDSTRIFVGNGLDSVKDFDDSKDFESVKELESAKNSGRGKDFIEGGKNFGSTNDKNGTVFETTTCSAKVAASPRNSPRREEGREASRSERERTKGSSMSPARYEVTKLLKQLCSGDSSGNRNERVSGAKNAQLLCVSGASPRQPSTPQLLRILEETIQKKAPKPMYQSAAPAGKGAGTDRFRMTLNIPARTTDRLFQYRTRFVQHMLTSPLYANSVVGKPWEMIGSVSEAIIDELASRCVTEMQLGGALLQLYRSETR